MFNIVGLAVLVSTFENILISTLCESILKVLTTCNFIGILCNLIGILFQILATTLEKKVFCLFTLYGYVTLLYTFVCYIR